MRSRVVIWTTASWPVSRCTTAATAIDDMRRRAIGLSVTLTASTPQLFAARAPSMAAETSTPFGGSISSVTTNSSGSASLRLKREVSIAVSATRCAGLSRTTETLAPAAARSAPEIAFAMARMCSGVVPQHPPMMAAPASA